MRCSLAWVFFWCGDIVSRPMNWFEFAGHLYPVYNWLMTTSNRIQGNGNGPWGPLESSREEHAG